MKNIKQWYTRCYYTGGSYFASKTSCMLTPTGYRKTRESAAQGEYWLLTEDYEPSYNMTSAKMCNGKVIPASSPAEYLKDYKAKIRQGVPRGMQLLEQQKHMKEAA